MSVYTKTGDKGETSLANGKRISKTDARIEAYGTVDELNSWIGLLRAEMNNDKLCSVTTNDNLKWLQNKLFNLGAELSCAPGEWITEEDVHRLEQWIDDMQSQLPPQRAFLLPSGSEIVAKCHVCRTICRRAERKMIAIEASDISLRWINRLSDYLFVLSRYMNFLRGEEEETWEKV